MNAVTRTGTTVKSFHTDVISVTLGRNLGMAILPLNNLIVTIPNVITRKTTASATAIVDEYLNESAHMKIRDYFFSIQVNNLILSVKNEQRKSLPILFKHANGANTAMVIKSKTKVRPVHQCSPNHPSNTPTR